MKIESVIRLRDADIDEIGNKAGRLSRLLACEPLLFTIPDGVVVLPNSSEEDIPLIKKLLAEISNGPFAVRSCGKEEDGAVESLAGKFHSELFVQMEQLPQAIEKVRASFGNSRDTSSVLIQEMISPDYAGVLFSRSPENYGMAGCEFCKGTADNLVSGKVQPYRVEFGRWSGKIYGGETRHQSMLETLFLVGLIIEEKIGCPQDIEWAYKIKDKQLYIIQSRDITSTVYNQTLAKEQQRVAQVALKSYKSTQKGALFRNSSVQEIVQSPSRLTRSLIETLYSVDGSLGRALKLLKYPVPNVTNPYVSSLFGQLYENTAIEKRIFGFSLRRLLANRKLKRQISKEPAKLQGWLTDKLQEISAFSPASHSEPLSAQRLAVSVFDGFQEFVQHVYPMGYVTTFVAQLAGEEGVQNILTSQMMRDFSRLHHTGRIDIFLEKWGLRSTNDYELSAPRFIEQPEIAKEYSASFADFPWHSTDNAEQGFTSLKETAKDMAIRWLYPLRLEILRLEKALDLQGGKIFSLAFSEIEALSKGQITNEEIKALSEQHLAAEKDFLTISFGSQISLQNIELLSSNDESRRGLQGKMVSTRAAFKGTLCSPQTLTEKDAERDCVLFSQFLEPEMVSLLPKCSGWLSDMGGALSHAAIVARELGCPVLVLSGAADVLQEGDYIEVLEDGTISINPPAMPLH